MNSKMKNTNKSRAYVFESHADMKEHWAAAQKGYAAAYRKGYSAVKISRIAGFKTASFVHKIFVISGEVTWAESGKLSSGIICRAF